jgi:ABC-type amino acid transport substrate-binding protein
MKFRKSVWVAVLGALLSSVASAQTLEKIERDRKVVLGHYPDSIPFAYFYPGSANKPVGFSIDLCLNIVNAVRKKLNIPNLAVEYRVINGVTRFTELESGKIDLECGSTTNNIERRKRVSFTIPHFMGGLKILSRTKTPIQDMADLNNRTIAHIKGGGDWPLIEKARESGYKVKVLEVSDTGQAFEAVTSGKADAMIWDDIVLAGLRADYKDPSALILGEKPLTIEPLALMFRKDDKAFKTLVDGEMRRMIETGEFHKLYRKWLEEPIPPKGIVVAYPMSFLLKTTLRYPSDQLGDDYSVVKGTMGSAPQ